MLRLGGRRRQGFGRFEPGRLRRWQQIDDEVGGMQKARVIVPVPSVESIASFAYRTEQPDYLKGRSSVLQAAGSETVFLEVVDNVPPSLSTNAETLMNGYHTKAS